jgi:hypothetical protein
MASIWEEAARAIAGGGVESGESEWEEVSSSHLDAVKFEGGVMYGTIYVRFKNGQVYYYPAETRATYEGLKSAASPGSYYWRKLRIG